MTWRVPAVPLKEHFESLLADKDKRDQQRYDAQSKALDAALLAADRAVQAALQAAEKAVTKAENAAEKRFESVNEFRTTLSDQAAQFLTRSEAEATMANIRERVQELTDRVNRSEGKAGGVSSTMTMVFVIGGLVIAAAAAIIGYAVNR